jgi:hypothetical protein
LLLIGTLVNDGLHGAVALLQGSWKMDDARPPQTVQPGGAEVSLIDMHAEHALAMTMGRACVEVAQTAEGTVAVLDVSPLHAPVYRSHVNPLQWSLHETIRRN